MVDHDDDDPAALFRSAIGKVTPLRDHDPSIPAQQRPRPRPRARMAEQDDALARGEFARLLQSTLPVEGGDVLQYRRDTLPHRTLQRLGKGQYSVQDELDLHGATAAQAENLLRQFLAEAHDHDHGCVRIIHGKGLQADGGAPVLKNLVDRMLRLRADVLAFHSAPANQGGTGAVLVLLARR